MLRRARVADGAHVFRRYTLPSRSRQAASAMIVAGGWSALINREASGLDAHQMSRRLLDQEVAPTRTTPWGETVAPTYLRLVLSN